MAVPLTVAELHPTSNSLFGLPTLQRLERNAAEDTTRTPLPALAMANAPTSASMRIIKGDDGAALVPWSANKPDAAFASLFVSTLNDPLVPQPLFANLFGDSTGQARGRLQPNSEPNRSSPDGAGGVGGQMGNRETGSDSAPPPSKPQTDNALLQAANSGVLSLPFGGRVGTTTSLTQSPDPVMLGKAVTFTATVAATSPAFFMPSGMVIFRQNGQFLGVSSLNGKPSHDQASVTVTASVVGGSTITATYVGDGFFRVVPLRCSIRH
jgi:hypothetical protein